MRNLSLEARSKEDLVYQHLFLEDTGFPMIEIKIIDKGQNEVSLTIKITRVVKRPLGI